MKAKTVITFTLLTMLMLSALACGRGGGEAQPTPTAQPTIVLPSFSEIVNEVMPSVVFILSELDFPGQPVIVSGSGVILSSDGYILTNRHVVEDASDVEVTLQDRRVYQASGVWMDNILDLAVVKIDAPDLTPSEFGDPDTISVGDWVIALGHSLGLGPEEGGATVTSGIVSNLGRSFFIDDTAYYDVIQTDAAINPGNSGGPLVNLAGEVIGINSAVTAGAENVGFAINIATARHVFEDLVQFGEPRHPYLGATVEDCEPCMVGGTSTV